MPPHSHYTVPVACDPDTSGLFTTPKARNTVILWRCRYCPHIEATRLEGAWTLQQIIAWGTDVLMPPGWPLPDADRDAINA